MGRRWGLACFGFGETPVPVRGRFRALVLAVVVAALTACGGEEEAPTDGRLVLRAWAHAGREDERRVLTEQVAAFNATHDELQVELTFLPEGGYDAQIQAAALADDLPDVLELDGPFVPHYAWQARLVPLDGLLPDALRARLLPSIAAQGTWRGRLYAVGQYDSGLGLFGRRSLLAAVGARIPEGPDDAWTVEDFDRILAHLAEEDDDGRVLDLKLGYGGEWFTYGFSPALWSAGGGLVRRDGDRTARGVLDGRASVAAMRWFRRWIHEQERVDPNLDDRAFLAGRVALSWVGHWEYRRYREPWGDDLVLLPLPDFGTGTRTGQGSWTWGITTRCPAPDAAARFLAFLLEDENVLAMTRLNAAVPATTTAADASLLHGPDGPLRLYVVQLAGGISVPRPRTPAYPVITSVFQETFGAVRDGGDVAAALGRAAAEIDRDLEDNRGYPSGAEDGPR